MSFDMSLSEYYRTAPLPKPEPRKRAKARKARAEARQQKSVRIACKLRDGDCRICDWENNPDDWHADDLPPGNDWPTYSALCHMHERRRSKTRGMDPAYRHDTRFCFMGCVRHHELYDAKRIIVTAMTRRGANGPLKFKVAR